MMIRFGPDKIGTEELRHLYWDEPGHTIQQIADMYGVKSASVRDRLIRDGIPIRDKRQNALLVRAQGRGQRTNIVYTQAILKEWLTCKKCGAEWKYEGLTRWTKCPGCGARKNAVDQPLEYGHGYSKADIDRLKIWTKELGIEQKRKQKLEYSQKKRIRVLWRVSKGKPRCVRCGCDDVRLLELNHINGGGGAEHRSGIRLTKRYIDIVAGRDLAEDLEVLCRPCNSIHYLELKYGPLPIKVVWTGGDDV